jgi:hypothetical protein
MAHPAPPHLESMGGRPFSFYPPIVGIEHNEWTFVEGRWSEILVRNSKTEMEVWIPRNYLGEISKVDEPVMIVGLRRELEYKGGSLWPYTRRLLEMPASPSMARQERDAPAPPSPVSELRLGGTESMIGKLIAAALVVGVVLAGGFVLMQRQKQSGGTIEYKGVVQAELGLTAKSDYFEVVRKLGTPEIDKWRAETGEMQYRMLSYPKQDLYVILMGSDREGALYIGAKDGQWRTVHAVLLPGGKGTEAILRSLKRF